MAVNQSEGFCDQCLVDPDRNPVIFVFTAVRRCRIYCSCHDTQLGALLFGENCKLMQDRVRKFMLMNSTNQNAHTNRINQWEAENANQETKSLPGNCAGLFTFNQLHLTRLCVNRLGRLAVKYCVSLKTCRLSQHLNDLEQCWCWGGNVTQFPVSHLEHIQNPPSSHLNNKFTLNERHYDYRATFYQISVEMIGMMSYKAAGWSLSIRGGPVSGLWCV